MSERLVHLNKLLQRSSANGAFLKVQIAEEELQILMEQEAPEESLLQKKLELRGLMNYYHNLCTAAGVQPHI